MDIKKFGFYFLLGIIVIIGIKFYTVIYDFIPSLVTGGVLAYLFNPLYLYVKNKTGRETLSGFIIIFICICLILIPVTFLIGIVPRQFNLIFRESTFSQIWNLLKNIDTFIYDKFNIRISEDFFTELTSGLISFTQNTITVAASKMLVNITRFVLFSFLSIFIMYYTLKNSRMIITTFRHYFPLSYKNIDILLDEVGKTTRTLILGLLSIAIVQGSVGALGFFLFGISGAIMWGIAMMIMSFLPIFGPAIIWFPAGMYLLVRKEFFNGIGLLLWGVLVVSTIDNLLRPKLTSYFGKIHPVTVLLGVFIGIKEWGIIGLIIGPIFIGVLITLIKMFREEYIDE